MQWIHCTHHIQMYRIKWMVNITLPSTDTCSCSLFSTALFTIAVRKAVAIVKNDLGIKIFLFDGLTRIISNNVYFE